MKRFIQVAGGLCKFYAITPEEKDPYSVNYS